MQELYRVMSMINNQPCSIFKGGKTRAQMLWGALSQHTQRPTAAAVAGLLGFTRCVWEGCKHRAEVHLAANGCEQR